MGGEKRGTLLNRKLNDLIKRLLRGKVEENHALWGGGVPVFSDGRKRVREIIAKTKVQRKKRKKQLGLMQGLPKIPDKL